MSSSPKDSKKDPKKVIKLRVDPEQGSDVRAHLQILKDRVTKLVKANPRKAAIILTDWIHRK